MSADASAGAAVPTCPRCGARYPREASFCSRDGARLLGTDARVGTLVAGDIVLTGVAGCGATGCVYRGWQRSVERPVAVKILRTELCADHASVARFEREARIASRLRHPHIVDVHLAGALDDGARFIAMEYLDGLSLRDALDAHGGCFEPRRAIDVVLQICDACTTAHASGIVHRDLKPENVVLVRCGEHPDWVKVLDFGIAKSIVGEPGWATATGLVFGTARYISPEGAAGSRVTPASDVYSLATLLYEMLVGRTPFDSDHGLALLVKQIHAVPPDIRDVPGGDALTDAIADVVMSNLAKDPRDRAPDAGALRSALVRARAGARDSGVRLVGSDAPAMRRSRVDVFQSCLEFFQRRA